jgi:hypothetical protein
MKSKYAVTNLVTFLHFVATLNLFTRSNGLINFNFGNAYSITPHVLLLHKLNNCELSSVYLNWFLSYLTNRQSCVRFSDVLSLHFVVLSGVLQGSVLSITPHVLLLHKLNNCELSLGYLNWFLSYLTNRVLCTFFWCTFITLCCAVRGASGVSFRAFAF